MPGYVLVVDAFGVLLAVIGFTMAFRQSVIRHLIGRPPLHSSVTGENDVDDPLTYILRIAGVMVMIFGIVIGGMVTLFHLA